jgi:hypothetical protein
MLNSDQLADFGPLEHRAKQLDELVTYLVRGLRRPIYSLAGDASGFRFPAPDLRHYCVLQLSSAVGNLFAALRLANGGFWYEVNVLCRLVIESTTHIDWMLHSQSGTPEEQDKAKRYLANYFADCDREELPGNDPFVKQKEVHQIIAAQIDETIKRQGLSVKPAAELLYTTYKRFSFYIHNRYPELMDRFDGGLGKFTLSGDRNPQKDQENFAIIESQLDSTTLSGLHVAIRFDLIDALRADDRFAWISNFSVEGP